MIKKFFLFSFFCLIFFSCASAEENTIKLILPNEEIILKNPIEVANVEEFLDGGTLGVVIEDADGKIFKFCRDGKLREQENSLADALAIISGTKKPKPRHLFAYVEHPDIEGGVEIPIGSETERTILNMLRDWFSQNPSADELKKHVISILIQQISENFTP